MPPRQHVSPCAINRKNKGTGFKGEREVRWLVFRGDGAAGKLHGEGGQGELHGLAGTLEGPFWCCGEEPDSVAEKGGRVLMTARDMGR